MASIKVRDYRTPLRIPAATCGEYEIKHTTYPAGTKIPLNSFRNAVLGGQRAPESVVFDTPTTWHSLTYEGGTWMTDLPIEQRQIDALLKGLRGRVLVGGLGLGYALHTLTQRTAVTHVTCVEIAPEVVKLVGPYTGNKWLPTGKGRRWKYDLVTADLLEWLKTYEGPPFDHAFYDIWQLDGESTFHNTVVPLHQLSAGKGKSRPRMWQEDVMRGQLAMGLTSRLAIAAGVFPKLPQMKRELWEYDGTDEPWWNWCVPFFRWWKDARPRDAGAAVQAYAGLYGLAGWEQHWDELKHQLR